MKLLYSIEMDETKRNYNASYIENGSVLTESIPIHDYFYVKNSSDIDKYLEAGKTYIEKIILETIKGVEYKKVYLKNSLHYDNAKTNDEIYFQKQLRFFVYGLTKHTQLYEYDIYPYQIKTIYENKLQFLDKSTELKDVPYCVFDIEVETSTGVFPTPENNFVFYIGARGITSEGKDVKFYKSVADYTKTVSEYGTKGEEALLIDFLKFLDDGKFVIISGYNIFNFDLYFINERLKKYNLKFAFNDDEIYQNINKTRDDGTFRHPLVKFQNPQYKQFKSKKGRIVFFDIFYYTFRIPVDRQKIKYQYGSVSLKNVSDYFGALKRKERVIIEGSQIYSEFLKNPEYMTQYLVDDVESTHTLYQMFEPIMLYLSWYSNTELGYLFDASQTQILERTLYKVLKKKGLVVFPRREEPYTTAEIENFEGGNTKLHAVGYFENIVKLDFSSLYPSIMLDWKLKPEKDEDGIFIEALEGLYKERIGFKKEAKKLKKEDMTSEEKDLYTKYTNYSAALKIMINSAYGLLGYKNWKDKRLAGSRFSNIAAASRVTELGRNMITSVENMLLKRGYIIIETDTDGIMLTKQGVETEAEILELGQKLMAEINSAFRKLGKTFATIDIEDIYAGVVSIKKKNYVTFEKSKSGIEVSPHGSTFIDSRKPQIIKKTINDIITTIITTPDIKTIIKKFNFLFLSSPLKKEYDFIDYCKKFSNEDFYYSLTIKEGSAYKSGSDIEQKVLLSKFKKYHNTVQITADMQIQYFKSINGIKAGEKDELIENFDRNILDYRIYLQDIKKSLIGLLLYVFNLSLAKGTNIDFDNKDKKVKIKNTNFKNPYSDDAVFNKNWFYDVFVEVKKGNESEITKRQEVITTVYNHKIVGEESIFRPFLGTLLKPVSEIYSEYLNKMVSNYTPEKITTLKKLYYNKNYASLSDGSEKMSIKNELTDDEIFLFDTGLIEKYIPAT